MPIKPGTITLRDPTVLAPGLIPAGLERFHRNRRRRKAQLRQRLKPTIEEQLKVRILRVQALQQRNQPLQLRRATLLRQAHEAVQRIQKQAAITLTTQACGALKQVLLPLGAGQVCYIALPLVITLAARQLRSTGRGFILGRQFTN